MQSQDKPKFAELLTALCGAFGKEPDEALFEGYWFGVEDLEFGEFRNAVARAIRECEFMPKPVELRRLSGRMRTESRAVIAFDAVSREIRQRGAYTSVDFDDPVINATVRALGGWEECCRKSSEEWLKWTRKEFEKIYCALADAGISEEQAKYLPGRHEVDNSARGYEVKAPVMAVTGLPPHEGQIVRLIGPSNVRLLTEKMAGKMSVSA